MTEPVAPVWSQRFGRPKVRVVMPLVALVTLVAWGAAAQVGGSRSGGVAGDGGPLAAATQPAPIASGSPARRRTNARATPGLTLHGEPLSGNVLVLGDGLRSVDLATGTVGGPLGPTDWSSRVHVARDGTLWCVCGRVSYPGGETLLELRIARVTAEGRVATGGAAPVLGRWIGAIDRDIPARDQGESAWSASALSPDGAFAFVGVTVRRPPVWQRQVLVVDLRTWRVVQTVDLVEIAAYVGRTPIHAWAPAFQVAPDGRHLLVSGTVVQGGGAERQDVWLAPIEEHGLGELRVVDGFDPADCPAAAPAFASSRVLYALCIPESGRSRTLRRVALEGGILPDVDLTDALGGGWPTHLVDGGAGRIFLWDPFGWRATAIDASSGTIVGSVSVPPAGAAVGADPLEVALAALAGLADLVAPPTAAKMLLEPAMALSPDGTRLYAVGVGRGETDASHVLVFDVDGGLDLVDQWTVPGLASGIGVRPDGMLVVPTQAIFDASGTRLADGGLTILDAATGRVRAVVEGLGDRALLLVDAAWAGG